MMFDIQHEDLVHIGPNFEMISDKDDKKILYTMKRAYQYPDDSD